MSVILTPEGNKFYYNSSGQLHRKDGCAAEWTDGTKYWYTHGIVHRSGDEPAVIDADGNKFYFNFGKLSRKNDKPAIEYASGEKWWIVDGVVTRDNNPAVVYANGDKVWCKNGLFHRIGGYAIERSDPRKCEYWVDGIKFDVLAPSSSALRSGNGGSFQRQNLPLHLQMHLHSTHSSLKNYSGWLTYPNGDKVHYYNGQIHSAYLERSESSLHSTSAKLEPAIIRLNGDKEWYEYDKLHRGEYDSNGVALPTIEYANGDKEWYSLGVLHRMDGPAIVTATGDKFYYTNGSLNRNKNLPAIEFSDGSAEWWTHGVFQYSILN